MRVRDRKHACIHENVTGPVRYKKNSNLPPCERKFMRGGIILVQVGNGMLCDTFPA